MFGAVLGVRRFSPRRMPTFVVTGCSSGIGLDMVKTLAARGDKVFALVRGRGSSKSGADEISQVAGDVTVVEGIDVAKDDVGAALAKALAGVSIDVLVNNSGISGDFGPAQKLENVSMDNMRSCMEVNALGPLRVTQALMGQLASPGGKVVTINTGMGSIADNGSGGMYAYRASKAAANMVTKCLAADLKSKGVSVAAIAPGLAGAHHPDGDSDDQGDARNDQDLRPLHHGRKTYALVMRTIASSRRSRP